LRLYSLVISSSNPDLVTNSLHNRPRTPLIQPIQRLHILPTQLKPIHVRILSDATGRIALRERHPIFLQTVSDQDLRGGFLVGFGEREERGVVGFVVADQGRVGFDDDGVVVAVGDYGALLAPGVELVLLHVNKSLFISYIS